MQTGEKSGVGSSRLAALICQVACCPVTARCIKNRSSAAAFSESDTVRAVEQMEQCRQIAITFTSGGAISPIVQHLCDLCNRQLITNRALIARRWSALSAEHYLSIYLLAPYRLGRLSIELDLVSLRCSFCGHYCRHWELTQSIHASYSSSVTHLSAAAAVVECTSARVQEVAITPFLTTHFRYRLAHGALLM